MHHISIAHGHELQFWALFKLLPCKNSCLAVTEESGLRLLEMGEKGGLVFILKVIIKAILPVLTMLENAL